MAFLSGFLSALLPSRFSVSCLPAFLPECTSLIIVAMTPSASPHLHLLELQKLIAHLGKLTLILLLLDISHRIRTRSLCVPWSFIVLCLHPNSVNQPVALASSPRCAGPCSDRPPLATRYCQKHRNPVCFGTSPPCPRALFNRPFIDGRIHSHAFICIPRVKLST